MKRFTHLTSLLTMLTLLTLSYGFAQKVAVIGMNHVTIDGFAFVALEDLPASEVVYFTEDEYDNTTGFFSSGESVVQFTATTLILKGDVVFVKEIATDTFTVTCTGGACGNALEVSPGGFFSLATGGEHMYAYSDTDNDPTNGVTEIYAVMYTIPGSIIPIQDPSVDHPNAIVTDGFGSGAPDRTEYMFSPATERDGVLAADFENPANYLNGSANADLSLVPFTNFLLGIHSESISFKIYPNPASDYINIESINPIDTVELFDINGRMVINSEPNARLDVSGLPQGLYILKLTQQRNVIYKKIIKN